MPNWKRLAAEGIHGADSRASCRFSRRPLDDRRDRRRAGPSTASSISRRSDPKTGRKVPVSGHSRAVPAVWNLASAAGRKVGVVGWWATHPAEEVNGLLRFRPRQPAALRETCRAPASPSRRARGRRRAGRRARRRASPTRSSRGSSTSPPGEIAKARASGAGMENPIVALARILAATRVYHRIARDLYDRNRPDLMALYLQGTDEIAHVFAPYTAAAPGVRRRKRTSGATTGRCRCTTRVVDKILGQWMRRAQEDGATLVVHSDHGFKWGADRPCERSSQNWNTAAYWHRLDGVFAAWGARVSPASRARQGVGLRRCPDRAGPAGPSCRPRGCAARPSPAASAASPRSRRPRPLRPAPVRRRRRGGDVRRRKRTSTRRSSSPWATSPAASASPSRRPAGSGRA